MRRRRCARDGVHSVHLVHRSRHQVRAPVHGFALVVVHVCVLFFFDLSVCLHLQRG
jgi:hypothetical protein